MLIANTLLDMLKERKKGDGDSLVTDRVGLG